MSAAAKAKLAANLTQVGIEAAGVLAVSYLRHVDVPQALHDAIMGDTTAERLLRTAKLTVERIAAAGPRTPVLCVSCPRPVRRCDAYVVGLALPWRADPSQGVAFVLCESCAATDNLDERAAVGLRRIWPDLRCVSVNSAAEGRA